MHQATFYYANTMVLPTRNTTYSTYIETKKIASLLLSLPFKDRINTIHVEPNITITSRIIVESVVSGLITPAIPKTKIILNTLLPITLPKASSF